MIRERILKGEIPLGAPQSRRKLASELGMSLLPVAEALQSLESEGLIESRPRVGTRVRLPTPAQIRERYEIREALESQAARLYAQRACARDKREMEHGGADGYHVQPRRECAGPRVPLRRPQSASRVPLVVF